MRLVIVAKNIPLEISEALESRTFSLHIKGRAGTGKTTMALELMRLFPEESEAIYLSTRVSPDKLYEQFPWSKSCIHQENILDAKTSAYQKQNEQSLFEYVDKPSFFRSLYSRVLDVNRKHVTIIMDSLEALKSNLKIPQDDLSIESDILEMVDRLDANVIFVSETDKESKMDYLVDGVVRLEREIVNGRLLRKLYIEKIRGTIIENPSYLFTLKDGRFTFFERGLQTNFRNIELPNVNGNNGRKISTSIVELDKILGGGFERGTFNLFEVGDMIGVAHAYIVIPMFFEFMFQGFPVFYIPSKGFYSSDIVRHLPQSLVNTEIISTMKKYFYVFKPPQFDSQPLTKSFKQYIIEGEDFYNDLRDFKKLAVKILDDIQADTIFVLMASDTMEYIYGKRDLLKIIQNWMDELKRLNGIIMVFQFGHESLRLPTHLASTIFKIENVGGNIVFYGNIPKTKIHVAMLDICNGLLRTRLVPIE